MVTELLTAPTRLLHPWRRRAARRALSARAPRSILLVCHGNICRSPFAAVLLQRALGPAGIRVHSAGFIGPNRPSPPEAVTAAARYGVNLSDHRSRVLTADLVRSTDPLVVMDPAQRQEGGYRLRATPPRADRMRSHVRVRLIAGSGSRICHSCTCPTCRARHYEACGPSDCWAAPSAP